MNSKLSGRKTAKLEIQMLSCNGGLKADEYWMSAETSRIRDVARVQRYIASIDILLFQGVKTRHSANIMFCSSVMKASEGGFWRRPVCRTPVERRLSGTASR